MKDDEEREEKDRPLFEVHEVGPVKFYEAAEGVDWLALFPSDPKRPSPEGKDKLIDLPLATEPPTPPASVAHPISVDSSPAAVPPRRSIEVLYPPGQKRVPRLTIAASIAAVIASAAFLFWLVAPPTVRPNASAAAPPTAAPPDAQDRLTMEALAPERRALETASSPRPTPIVTPDPVPTSAPTVTAKTSPTLTPKAAPTLTSKTAATTAKATPASSPRFTPTPTPKAAAATARTTQPASATRPIPTIPSPTPQLSSSPSPPPLPPPLANSATSTPKPLPSPSASPPIPASAGASVALPPPSASASTPRSSPSPSSSPSPANARAAETAAVRAALDSYRAAFESLSSESVKSIWPAANAAALSRAFKQMDSQSVDFYSCGIELGTGNAEATCSGAITYVPKIGAKTPRVEQRSWTFYLSRQSDHWIIDRVVSK